MRERNNTELKNIPPEELANTTSAYNLPVELREEKVILGFKPAVVGLTHSHFARVRAVYRRSSASDS